MGAETFTLNIIRVNGSVAIDTGIIQASVTQTVFYQNPVSILLLRANFGKEALGATRSGNEGVGAAPPEISFSPESSPSLEIPLTHLSSPPGFCKEIRSGAAVTRVQRTALVVALCCIALY
nr:TPA_asm: hypothetical protein HUJ06_031096 [Nelumbo nucifera]